MRRNRHVEAGPRTCREIVHHATSLPFPLTAIVYHATVQFCDTFGIFMKKVQILNESDFHQPWQTKKLLVKSISQFKIEVKLTSNPIQYQSSK
jgi:hypothetical protein